MALGEPKMWGSLVWQHDFHIKQIDYNIFVLGKHAVGTCMNTSVIIAVA